MKNIRTELTFNRLRPSTWSTSTASKLTRYVTEVFDLAFTRNYIKSNTMD